MATETDTTDDSGEAAPGDEEAAGRPELRIALVLNGGVSLAVWIGGVVHELNRLRLATRGVDEGGKAWAGLATAANRRVSIDLIAGTSAGGLNGALLATAIANGRQMTNMKQVWNKVGSLTRGALVYHPDSSEGPEPTSILDGDFVARQIVNILAGLAEYPSGEVCGEECTLLLTATTLTAEARAAQLPTGQSISVRDSRRVYKFVSDSPIPQDPRANALADKDCVAAAMRATASFPGAFAPVREVAWPLQGGTEPSVDNAQLRPWLIDGGVLDNAPFEPLLQELLKTPIRGAQERLLMYVTPSIEALRVNGSVPETTAAHDDVDAPPSLPTVLQYVAKAFGEPDQRLDHEALVAVFSTMNLSASQPHTYLRTVLFGGEGAEVGPLIGEDYADQLLNLYQVSRREAGIRFIDGVAEPRPYLAPLGLPRLPETPYPGVPDTFANSTDPWQWGLPSADRILRWIGRALAEEGLEGAGGQANAQSSLDGALGVVRRAQRQVRVLGGLRRRSVAFPPAAGGEPGEPFAGRSFADLTFAERRHWQVLRLTEFYEGDPRNADVLTTIMNDVVSELQGLTGIDEARLRTVLTSVEVVYCCFNWGGQTYDTPRFKYAHLTPAELGTDPAAPLSPNNQTVGPGQTAGVSTSANQTVEPKLYGELWAHFGAFATASGREHDWLWGRLDCAEAIVNQLGAGLSEADLAQFKDKIFDEILAQENSSVAEVTDGLATVRGMTNQRLLGQMGATSEGLEAIDLLLERFEKVTVTGAAGPLLTGLFRGARMVIRSKIRSMIRDDLDVARLADEDRLTVGAFGWRLGRARRRAGKILGRRCL